MNKQEKLQKMQLLKDFCSKSEIDDGELMFLFNEMAYAACDFAYDIYYEDGTISKKLDLNKTPLAVKLSSPDGFYWACLQTTFPKKMVLGEVEAFLQTLPKIPNCKWRIAYSREMNNIIDNRRGYLDELQRLQRFFCLPKLFMKDQEDSDGRFCLLGCYHSPWNLEICGICSNFPGMIDGHLEEAQPVLWWPVCDAK